MTTALLELQAIDAATQASQTAVCNMTAVWTQTTQPEGQGQ